MFCSCLIFLLQSTIPEIIIVFLLYILQFIRIIIDVEIHPSPGTYNSNLPVNITINNVDKYIFMCNINIRSVRNKLLNYTFFKISPICITESHLDVNINNNDLLLDFFSKTFIRKNPNNSGSGLFIY